MPSDPLKDAIYFKIEETIADNYRDTEGGYLVSPSAVATLATSAALAAIEEQGYAIAPILGEEPQLVVRNITSWVPYSPELVVDMTGLPVEEIRDRYGDTVLVRMGVNGPLELKRGGAEPSPAEMRETAAILRQATAPGTAPQPSETPQDAQTAGGGISGRSDTSNASTGLSAPQADDLHRRYAEAIRHAMFGPHSGDAAIDGVFDRSAAPAARAVMAVRDTELETVRRELEAVRAGFTAPDDIVYNLVWVAARNEHTRSWLAAKGLVVMQREVFDKELADLHRKRGEAEARADRMAEMVIEKDREATQWAERLHKAEAALVHAKALHSRDDSNPHGPWCGTCTTHWPCHTWIALLSAEEQTGDGRG